MWEILIVSIFSEGNLVVFSKTGIVGGGAEREAAALLFEDYSKGSTPTGSVKHLYVEILYYFSYSLAISREPEEVFGKITDIMEASYAKGIISFHYRIGG